MVVVLLKILPLPAKRAVVLDLLNSVQKHTAVIGECMGCMVCEERNADKPAILYLERWESRTALYRHLRSGLYLRILHCMDLSSEPPEINFYEVSESAGLELIESVRNDA